ncbi:unnamed protein product [Rotaria socialis]
MISKIVHATSCTVKCPICGKSMLLKNWKDHCRQFHAMSQTAIDCKYYELKRNIKQSNLSTVTLDTTTNSENPNSMPINTLFSMKKFVLVKSTITNENTQAANVDNQVNQSQLMEIDSQNTHLDTPINYIELEPLPIISDSYLSLNENDISCSNHESCNLIVSTPSSSKILLQINEIFRNGNDEISNNSNRVQPNDIQLHYETIAEDKESEGKETDNNLISTPASTKNIGRLTSSRSLIMSKHIEGVKFITSNEVTFIDTQRKNHPSINWHTDDKQKQVKPSRAWFSKNFQWVRAVCTDNRYGLICVDCDEYARDKTLIERNKGAFVVRPYWKLKHKGLDGFAGIKNHQNSDLHRASREKRIATKIVANIGWTRFDIKVAENENEFESKWGHWYVAYHGTKSNFADLILSSGLTTGPGCWAAEEKVVYVSPSIEYCAHPRYAEPWNNPNNGKYHQLVFQCRVNPKCLNVDNTRPETLLRNKNVQIDKNFSNKQLEWIIRPPSQHIQYITDDIICYGLMLRTTDGHPQQLPSSHWWKS